MKKWPNPGEHPRDRLVAARTGVDTGNVIEARKLSWRRPAGTTSLRNSAVGSPPGRGRCGAPAARSPWAVGASGCAPLLGGEASLAESAGPPVATARGVEPQGLDHRGRRHDLPLPSRLAVASGGAADDGGRAPRHRASRGSLWRGMQRRTFPGCRARWRSSPSPGPDPVRGRRRVDRLSAGQPGRS